jgi:hypothetical protein
MKNGPEFNVANKLAASRIPIQIWTQASYLQQKTTGALEIGQSVVFPIFMMGAEGLEPSRPCDQRILSPLRLPFRHAPKFCSGSCFRRNNFMPLLIAPLIVPLINPFVTKI